MGGTETEKLSHEAKRQISAKQAFRPVGLKSVHTDQRAERGAARCQGMNSGIRHRAGSNAIATVDPGDDPSVALVNEAVTRGLIVIAGLIEASLFLSLILCVLRRPFLFSSATVLCQFADHKI